MKTYLRHKIANVIDVKELIALEFLDFEGKYKDYTEKHDFWELCWVQEGEVVLSVNGVACKLCENEVVLIAPGQTHSYRSAKGNESCAFVICFESGSYAVRPLNGAVLQLEDPERSCLERIAQESAGTFYTDENDRLAVLEMPYFGGQQAIFLQLEYLLICLLRRYSQQKSSDLVFLGGETFYNDLVRLVIRYFRDHIRERLTLQEICSRFNYSRSFLCKTFREETGETLMACFNRMKVEEAQRMLDRTSLSATEIATQLGFAEAKYFGTLFKKLVGVSPIAYRDRKAMREEKTVKLADKLWNWGHLEGSHDKCIGKPCFMTPEGFAEEYGVPNAFIVSYSGNIQPPFHDLAKRLSGLREIKWSVLGDALTPLPEDELGNTKDILEVLDVGGNITGGVVDDFFSPKRMERFTPEVLMKIRAALNKAGRDFWCVLYAHQLEMDLAPYLECFDGITFWIWKSEDIANNEAYLEKLFALANGKPVMLGMYFWDYASNKEIPPELFEQQLTTAIDLLKEKRSQGIVFCSGAIGDAGLETQEILKRYIREQGETEI